jgi:hypothetical protein
MVAVRVKMLRITQQGPVALMHRMNLFVTAWCELAYTVPALIIEPPGDFRGGTICCLANVRPLVQYWQIGQTHWYNCISAGARPGK